MNIFAKIVNGYKPFTIFVKGAILDVWQGSEYVTDSSSEKLKNTMQHENTLNWIYFS